MQSLPRAGAWILFTRTRVPKTGTFVAVAEQCLHRAKDFSASRAVHPVRRQGTEQKLAAATARRQSHTAGGPDWPGCHAQQGKLEVSSRRPGSRWDGCCCLPKRLFRAMSRLFLDVAEYWPACGWEAAIVLPVFLVVRAGLLLSLIKKIESGPPPQESTHPHLASFIPAPGLGPVREGCFFCLPA